MRRTNYRRPSLGLSRLWLLPAIAATLASAFKYKAVAQPPLYLDDLGKVGIVGDFDAISLYSYEGQGTTTMSGNGGDSVMVQLENGAFVPLVTADADIDAMCTFELKNGTVLGVIVGGNFTSLGKVPANGIALVNPDDGSVTALSGLTGKVHALLCDKDTETVYVGGQFRGANSSNALAWGPDSGWQNLPFEGFNKPVKSIVKSSNNTIVFGGLFDGLGNMTAPTSSHTQSLNLQSAKITAEQTTDRAGFNDPKNIICSTGDGAGSAWLLADGQVGSWTADFRYEFKPTKLRLRNTHFEGRGTAEFRFTAFPINGILNLSYIDPADGKKKYCESRCPLSGDSKATFQDFFFENVIGMKNFRIDISRFYGASAGLAGIQLFLDDVYSYAVTDLNEPSCAIGDIPSRSEVKGDWAETTAFADSAYLTATVQAETAPGNVAVTFFPDVQQSGNYSVVLFTPGCIQDGTCSTRGGVNITGMYTKDQKDPVAFPPSFQTNNFDKYDIVYTGYVDAADGNFRPSVTLTASEGQSGTLTMVAQKIRFDLVSNSTGGLNGVYEYVPGADTIAQLDSSVVTSSTKDLEAGARVFAITSSDSKLYFAGNFTSKNKDDGMNNVYFLTRDGPAAFTGKGLNGLVWTMIKSDNIVYLGGEFKNTVNEDVSGLNRLAAYDTTSDKWSALGAGVNGRVIDLVPLTLSIDDKDTLVIAVSGDFTEILANDGKQAVSVAGFAIWVPSKNEWLLRMDVKVISLTGSLSAAAVAGNQKIFSGSISSSDLLASGAVKVEKPQLTLKPLPLKFTQNTNGNSTLAKREISADSIQGVATEIFYRENGKDLTIVGGHFTHQSGDVTVQNLAIIDHNSNDAITGISAMDAASTYLTLHINSGVLYAGGSIKGRVGQFDVTGMIVYDLAKGALADDQPAGLQGGSAVVRTIAAQPKSEKIFVGGSFELAGSFSCPSLCVYDKPNLQWTRPGVAIGGTINAMQWVNVNELLVVGDMIINGTSTYVARLDAKNLVWLSVGDSIQGNFPGPVTSLAFDSDTGETFFVAGNSTQGASFLRKWNGREWKDVTPSFGSASIIRGIQVLSLGNSKHDKNDFLQPTHILLVTGSVVLDSGTYSGVLFNGLTWSPFIITSKTNNKPSSLAALFSQYQQSYTVAGGKLAKGFVILIALAISLGLVFLIVVLGVLASYIRRRKEGYQPAPKLEKAASLQDRVPPTFLFGGVGSPTPEDERL